MTKKETPENEGREVPSIKELASNIVSTFKQFTAPAEMKEMAETIVSSFKEFKVPIELVEAIDGYSCYHFHVRPLKPMRMKAFASFVEDLKYALSNDSVEIEAPIPNQKLVGITVQKKTELPPVWHKDALEWEELKAADPLVVPLGIDEFGERQLVDIARMPHMLMAGTTGSGKSVLLHSFINTLLSRNNPDELRFIMIDPKRVELTQYAGLPHLLTPPITKAKKAVQSLSWAIKEMERRYDILESEQVQNITAYQQNIYNPAKEQWEKDGAKPEDKVSLPEPMPFILIIVDEINDLMQSYPSEFEGCFVRLAQMSRPVGIHLILATQRPSVDVITGTMKANIPTRIAMMVASQVDSRTVIHTTGAEKLRGSGDMLYLSYADPKPQRIQSLYISEEEIAERIKPLREEGKKSLEQTLDLASDNSNDSVFNLMVGGGEPEDDELYEETKAAVIEAGKASTSYIQRKLRIGYSRAARLMDLLEEGGVIGPVDGSKARDVLIDRG